MGIPVSLILIAVGAILAFAVNQDDPSPAVDVDVVGWIVLLVGLFGLLLSLLLWERWGPGYFGWHRGPHPADTGAGGYPRRRTVVEEEEGPPGPPAPPGPPPP